MSKKKDKKSSKAINSDLYIPNMLKAYREHVVPSMVSRFNYDNSMQVPKILSIAINMGLGEDASDGKKIKSCSDDMALIAGQKPIITKFKKSISNFKTRKGSNAGIKVTLRAQKMYEFIERMIKIALPRISDVIEERNDTITDDLDEAKALSLEAEKVVDELKSKLEDARSSSQKKLMDERQKSLDIVSSERKKFEENISKEISSSEEKINKGKVEALKEASDLAIDIAEEIINNLYVKKVDKKDLNKFSKDLN